MNIIYVYYCKYYFVYSASFIQWLLIINLYKHDCLVKKFYVYYSSTVSRARLAVIICWTSAIIYNLPRFFERVTEFKMTSNDTVPTVARTTLRDNYYYVVLYKSALFFFARFLLPFSTIAFFNTRLILAIRASARLQASDRRGCGELKRRERYTLTIRPWQEHSDEKGTLWREHCDEKGTLWRWLLSYWSSFSVSCQTCF